MAVLEEVPGVTITVRVNGVDSVEYDDPEAPNQQHAQPTSSKYIESPDDTEFTINVKIDGRYNWSYKNHSVRLDAYVDAVWINGAVFLKDMVAIGAFDHEITGKDEPCQDSGYWLHHKLKFSAVKTVDDTTRARVRKDKKASRNLGLIEVQIWRVTTCGSTAPEYNHQPKASMPKASIELAEKSIKGKAISHATTFSKAAFTNKPNFVDPKALPGDDGPIAVFAFRYRSKKALQQELIIPATPPHLPSLDGLSEAEMRRLAAERLLEINEEKLIKKERVTVVKRELSEIQDLTDDNRPSKIRRIPSEVVDLTDD